MKATIVCDSENTVRFIDYLLRTGSCNSRTNEMRDWGIDVEDTKLGITYSIEKPTEVELIIEEPKTKKTKKKDDGNPTLYAARCVETGKLVSDITNPSSLALSINPLKLSPLCSINGLI